MKKTLTAFCLFATLFLATGCDTPRGFIDPLAPRTTPGYNAPAEFSFEPSYQSDARAIEVHALILSKMVMSGKITKVQAAQYLNIFRRDLVGGNPIDDAAYEVYLNNAIRSQKGEITSTEAKNGLRNALENLRNRWNSSQQKPTRNPAFTAFLLKFLNLPPLNSY